ncbi:MAG: TetR/AcrR family transcriptional regulator [Bacteriovoracaceae bacterium]|jgi:TetR/AcrR family transcriptional regulator|nr:TetR/AcrR family transcriptional regulator [Bacteriovoracaceae bacterium]
MVSQNRALSTKEKILDGARILFIKQGLSRTSMSQVAKSCGVSKALIFHHFTNKENLWTEVKDWLHENYKETQAQAMDLTHPLLALKTMFENKVAENSHMKDYIWLKFWEMFEGKEKEDFFDEFFMGQIKAFIELGQTTGQIYDGISPISIIGLYMITTEFWPLISGEMAKALHMDDKELDDLFYKDTLKLLYRGIKPEGFEAPEGYEQFDDKKTD